MGRKFLHKLIKLSVHVKFVEDSGTEKNQVLQFDVDARQKLH